MTTIQPVHSIVTPFDASIVRTSLRREARRGGQSFVICPRIEDITPMQARLQTLVPELSLTVVHGRMAGDVLDNAMMAFARGDCDVLLATNHCRGRAGPAERQYHADLAAGPVRPCATASVAWPYWPRPGAGSSLSAD